MHEPPKKALLEKLLAERKINREQFQLVLEHARVHGTRIEDALIETSSIDEPSLLAWLAALYQTRFVSTEKLARAEIDRATLALLPRELAERLEVFPVAYDAGQKTLAFVTADPDNLELARELRSATRSVNVRPYLARSAAVRAAISKHYHGNIHAFSKVEQRNVEQNNLLARYGHTMFDEETIASRSATGLRSAPSAFGSSPTSTRGALADPPSSERILPMPPEHELRAQPGRNSLPAPALGMQRDPSMLPRALSSSQTGSLESGVSFGASIEVATVLVSLLENSRQSLRGHSALVARSMQKLGDYLKLSRGEVYGLRLCGLLHDLGKSPRYHLTALNVAEYEAHRSEALKCFVGPVRLFDGASLPKGCVDGLTSLYERFDGQGFPERRSGKEIPLAARLLAIAESYADLTANVENPFRRLLTANMAMDVLGRYRDQLFDGGLLDLFRKAAVGEEMQSRLLEERARILLVDTDVEETTVLELRLVEQGHEVLLCRSAEQAYQRFQQGGIDLLIAEVELEPHDGFTLVEHIRKQRGGAELPVLFLTHRTERVAIDRGFALGALDYMSKPAAPDVVVAKVRSVLTKLSRQRVARGVSGALREMPLPDVLQVLARSKKSGLLRVAAGGYVGEIQLGSGSIYDASFDELRGPEALFALLALTDGDFSLDPSSVPSSRVIHESTEQLLLEGMRRIDERARREPDLSTTRSDE